jgi:phenylacetate-CoA ligase
MDVLRVEVEPATAEHDRELLAAEAGRRLDRSLGLACEVVVLDEGQIPRSEGKALRVVDERAL